MALLNAARIARITTFRQHAKRRMCFFWNQHIYHYNTYHWRFTKQRYPSVVAISKTELANVNAFLT
jgi:hypothetical protein